MSSLISYAINSEDVLLWRALGHVENGFYIDAGASDPVDFSVTKLFYDVGWRGINLEPLPAMHRALVLQRPRDVNLAVALGAEEGVTTLFQVPSSNGWATTNPEVARAHLASGLEVQELQVPVTTLASVCLEHVQGDIHFLKVDVEGSEREVLRGTDFTRWRPWVLVIEATKPGSPEPAHQSWEYLLVRRGYHFAHFDGLNRFYVAEEHGGLLPAFATPPNVFDGFVPHAQHVAQLAGKRLEAELERLRARLAIALETANAIHARANDLELQVEAQRQSRSWRYTAPCRRVGELVRTVASRLGPVFGVGAATSSTLTGDQACAELPPLEVRLVGDLQRCIPPMTCPETASGSGARWRDRALALVDAPLPAVPAQSGSRPRLAYISPLPPARTGIADYSARLVPHLARHYDLTLIAPEGQGAGTSLAADFSLRDPTWLDRHAGEFDRLLYHFGNSGFHRYMCELLRRHPGTVVLHDFFLSHLVAGIAQEETERNSLSRALYESHGYTGLFLHRRLGTEQTIWKYPLNKGVVDDGVGVIVHSEFARQLAIEWYGPGGADDWRVVPLLCDPGVRRPAPGERERVRARLGLAEDDFLVCSFGVLGPIKLNEEVLEAFLASTLAGDARCHLVFVGEDDGGDYAARVVRRARNAAGGRIRVTGYVEPELYSSYLAAADLGVQLRARTRGESPAALLDCLLGGVPTIANAHGAASEVPRDVVCMLPEVCSLADLASALQRLRDDSALRAGLSHRAESFVREHHSPERVAQTYHEALEHLARCSARAGGLGLVRQIARRAGPASPSMPELVEVAHAIAAKLPPGSPRRLLVDVSAVAQLDHKTGIQRVVRGLLGSLLAEPPAGYRVQPVMSPGLGRRYRHASRFTLDLIGEDALKLPERTAEFSSGDIFLGLDFSEGGTAQNGQVLQSMRERGVRLYFIVYDILPVLRPGAFPPGAERSFEAYLRTIASAADGLVCISRTVADEVHRWASSSRLARATPLQIGYFHLGVGFEPDAAAGPAGRDSGRLLATLRARPSVLMVGTLEPRKGHSQALDAFELLWDEGLDVNLVIAGKQGWMVEALADRLRRHPQFGERLFWEWDASDGLLRELYGNATVLLAASEGEGFGLPLIEAARHGLPIIARDLPVFREVAGEHALYFRGLTPRDLAAGVDQWLALRREGKAPDSGGIRWLTWSQCARQLLDAIEHQRWYRQVPASGGTDE